MPIMMKRTIKPAAADSHITAAAAKAAARVVYRDRVTGKFVVAKREVSARTVREHATSNKSSARNRNVLHSQQAPKVSAAKKR